MPFTGTPAFMDSRGGSSERDAERWTIRPVAVVVTWTIPALLSTFQRWASSRLAHEPASFWRIAAREWPGWLFWAVMTPIIFRVAARYQFTAPTRVRATCAHVCTWLLCVVLHALVMSRSFDAATEPSYARFIMLTAIAWLPSTFLLYAATVGAAFWMQSLRHEQRQEQERAMLSVQLAQAELRALRSQLHPHFLFNTLNTIAILMREHETQISARLVTQLGDVLRHVLHGSRANMMRLGEEIAMLSTYLEIEQVRFGDRLRVCWYVDDDTLGAEVPSLVLQPLLENALRHAVALRTADGVVEIGARRDATRLVLWISDNGADAPVERDARYASATAGTGLGLANTRERLALLYRMDATLALSESASGGVRAEVRMPFRSFVAS